MKNTAHTYVLVFLFFGISLGSVFVGRGFFLGFVRSLEAQSQIYNMEPRLILGEHVIPLIISDTKEARDRGLSGLKSLDSTKGMLFVFDKPDFYSFWMKDMNFPIDIVWMDHEFTILEIQKNISPNTYPKVFRSPQKALYVLEVNAGFADKLKMKVGDSFILRK